MTTEIIDVIDTAVKIGLGALISGIVTYTVTKTKHSNERKRELLKRRLDIIEISISQADLHFNSLLLFQSAIDGIRMYLPKNTTLDLEIEDELRSYNFILDADKKVVETRTNHNKAESKLRLIGLDKAADILLSTNPIENELRQMVIFDKNLPSEEYLISWNKTLHEKIRQFHSEMAKGFVS